MSVWFVLWAGCGLFGGGNDPSVTDADGDGVVAEDDCNDADPRMGPGFPEVCDGVDNDCDDLVDDADINSPPVDPTPWHLDADRDGFGDPAVVVLACEAPAQHVRDNTDCDDETAARAPGLVERCDGLDNDCDQLVDDADTNSPPVDAPAWFLDDDDDGFGDPLTKFVSCLAPPRFVRDGFDCDDTTGDRAPDLDEVCDGIDNDCDDLIDDDDLDTPPIDRDIWHPDDDRDGYGDGSSPFLACFQPPGFVDDATDCNDTDRDISPGDLDRCDNIDNDCDGVVDRNVVPRDFATIQDAIDVGGVVQACVRPGTWSQPLVIDNQVVEITASDGPAVTAFDLASATGPFIRVTGDSGVVVQGFTVRNLDNARGGTPFSGAFVDSVLPSSDDGFQVGLASLVFESPRIRVENNPIVGGLVRAERTHVVLFGITVADLQMTLGGTAPVLQGGLLAVLEGEGQASAIDVTRPRLSTEPGTTSCVVEGGLFYAEEFAGFDDLFLGPLRSGGGTYTLDCPNAAGLAGAVVHADSANLDGGGWELSDNVVRVSSAQASALGLSWNEGGFLDLSEAEILGNVIEATGAVADASAPISIGTSSTSTLTDVVAYRNEVIATTNAYGGAVATFATLNNQIVRQADFRANRAFADTSRGGAMYSRSSNLRMFNVLFVGNQAGGPGANIAYGGGLYHLPNGGGNLTVEHGDYVDNRAEGASFARGGGIRTTAANSKSISHVGFVGNSVAGNVASGSALDSSGSFVEYGNTFQNTGAEPYSNNDPGDSFGNVQVEPGYVNVLGADVTTWDLRLQAGSQLRDAGDPSMTANDGTRVDIGAYGELTDW